VLKKNPVAAVLGRGLLPMPVVEAVFFTLIVIGLAAVG